jgi:hypothetical protein
MSLIRLVSRLARRPATPRDPIDHPAIARMGLRELADLPLLPARD